MDDVRQPAYAIEMGENEDGLMCIGVPFLDGAGYPIAAMSLSAPERRMKPAVTEHAAEALKSAARRISIKLGARFEDGSAGFRACTCVNSAIVRPIVPQGETAYP